MSKGKCLMDTPSGVYTLREKEIEERGVIDLIGNMMWQEEIETRKRWNMLDE